MGLDVAADLMRSQCSRKQRKPPVESDGKPTERKAEESSDDTRSATIAAVPLATTTP